MKKVVVLSVLLGLVAAAGAYWVYYQPFSKKFTAEQMLPTDTLATVRVEHLKQSIEKFRSSRLGTALSNIDLNSTLAALETPSAVNTDIADFQMRIKETLESTWFDALFGEQITLALLPTNIQDVDMWSTEEISKLFAIILRPKHPAGMLEWLQQMFARDIEVTTEPYDQWEINQFEWEQGVNVHYSITDGLVVFALHRQPVERCLDVLKEPKNSLHQNPEYQSVEHELQGKSEPEVFCFGNLRKLIDLGSNLLAKHMGDRPEYEQIQEQVSMMNGIYAAGCAAYDDGGTLLQKKIVLMIDRDEMEPQIIRAMDYEPQTVDILSMLPQSTLGFLWQNTLDLKLYYDNLIESKKLKPEDIETFETLSQEKIGVSLNELVESFGPQWGLALNSIKTGGMFPIPELGLFIQCVQPETAEKIIQLAAGQSKMSIQNEEYKGEWISYLLLPFGGDLRPSYAYIDGYCILAANTNLIKSYVDTIRNGENITGSDAFKAVDKGLSGKNNQVAYIKFDQLIDSLHEITKWGSSMAAFARPDKAGQITPVADQVVSPLLDGMKMYKTIGFRSFIAEKKIESQIYTEIEKVEM